MSKTDRNLFLPEHLLNHAWQMKVAHLSFPRRSPRYYCNGKGLHIGLVNQLLDYFSYSLHLQMDV